MQTFKASDGLTLAYTLDDFTDPWRTPETLILVHAAMGSHRRLYAWVPLLCRDFRVVRMDLRGHGASEIPGPDGLTLPRLARDVVDLADHLGVDRFHLAGSSAGAIISLATAIEYPARVRTLGSFATTPGLKPSNVPAATWVAEIRAKGVRQFLAERIKDRFDLSQVEPGFVEWFLDESARTSPELLARFVPLMATVDLTDQLHRIQCPTLSVVPDHDPISSMAQYEVLRDRIPNCEFVVYSGLPHNITDAAPERCALDLKRFLLTHRGRT
jgi:pimeloyl-ACP methyl ester carboxylesterase